MSEDVKSELQDSLPHMQRATELAHDLQELRCMSHFLCRRFRESKDSFSETMRIQMADLIERHNMEYMEKLDEYNVLVKEAFGK